MNSLTTISSFFFFTKALFFWSSFLFGYSSILTYFRISYFSIWSIFLCLNYIFYGGSIFYFFYSTLLVGDYEALLRFLWKAGYLYLNIELLHLLLWMIFCVEIISIPFPNSRGTEISIHDYLLNKNIQYLDQWNIVTFWHCKEQPIHKPSWVVHFCAY